MMPLTTYLRARGAARYHVQVELESLPRNVATPTEIRVSGRVLMVFRQARPSASEDCGLAPGDAITFEISIRRLGDEIPEGPVWWLDYEALQRTKALEVFLNGVPPQCEVAAWQARVIPGASDTPEMAPDGTEILAERPTRG